MQHARMPVHSMYPKNQQNIIAYREMVDGFAKSHIQLKLVISKCLFVQNSERIVCARELNGFSFFGTCRNENKNCA